MSLANHNRTQGVQCRTMTSQRPCGAQDCTREECSRARLSAQAFMAQSDIIIDTNDGTNIGSTGSVSVPQSESVSVDPETLVSLTRDELWSVWRAVRDTLPTRGNEAPLRTAWGKLNDALEL